MAGIGDYEEGKAFELRSGKKPAFKMLGSSPMKQDVGIQTGFGPEADANLKKKINIKTGKQTFTKKGVIDMVTSKEVTKFPKDKSMKLAKKASKKGIKKFLGKVIPVWGALETAHEVGKFGHDVRKAKKYHGLKKSMEVAWDKNKWWGDKRGNLFGADDPDPNEIKAIDLIRKAKIK